MLVRFRFRCSRNAIQSGPAWIITAVVWCGCEPRSPSDAARAAITNGVDDSGDPGVVALVSGQQIYCSGTLIAPRLVLSANHCVTRSNLPRVFFGSSLADGGEFRQVLAVRGHPGFDSETGANDIAVLLLAEPAPAEAAPVPLLEQAMEGLVGAEIRLVGFGRSSRADTVGRKRQGTTRVRELTAWDFTFGAEPSQTCVGDSGGPAFLKLGATEYLAGVTSAGDNACIEFGRDMRVDAYATQFLAPLLRQLGEGGAGAGDRCFYPRQCAAGECITAADDARISYCSVACRSHGDCPAAMDCSAGPAGAGRRCRYPAPTPGALGSSCPASSSCEDALCMGASPDRAGMCTRSCQAPTAVCPAGYRCVSKPGAAQTYCWPELGCSYAGGRDQSLPLGELALVLVALAIVRHHQRFPRSSVAPTRPLNTNQGGDE